MASWPSAKTLACTLTDSPTVRLIANRPSSISGATPSMTTRCLPSAGNRNVTGISACRGPRTQTYVLLELPLKQELDAEQPELIARSGGRPFTTDQILP